jgi:hypothetical protein
MTAVSLDQSTMTVAGLGQSTTLVILTWCYMHDISLICYYIR